MADNRTARKSPAPQKRKPQRLKATANTATFTANQIKFQREDRDDKTITLSCEVNGEKFHGEGPSAEVLRKFDEFLARMAEPWKHIMRGFAGLGAR